MAWISPTSVHNPTTGSPIPASWGDASNAAADFLATNKPHCLVGRSTTFTHAASGSFAAITFNQEFYDVGGCHSTVTNNTRITVPAGGDGKYVFFGNVSWGPSTAGRRILRFVLNGSSVIAQTEDVPALVGGASSQALPSPPVALVAGDWIELQAFQDTGGNIDIDVIADFSPVFGMAWYAT